MMFAKRFRGLRAESDLTQAEVAKILNVSPTTVATWEQNRSKPGLDTDEKHPRGCLLFEAPQGFPATKTPT